MTVSPHPNLLPLPNLAVAILAGGQSRRMGRPKKDLKLHGQSLLEIAVSICQSIDCNYFTIEDDLRPGQGPLGGIETAFAQITEEWILFLPCDMPFLKAETLQQVLQRSSESGRAAFAECRERIGFPFTLHRRHLPSVSMLLAEGRRSLKELARVVTAERVVFGDAHRHQFFNINTVEEWEQALAGDGLDRLDRA